MFEGEPPTNYFSDVNVVQCAAAAIHSCVRADDGNIYSFGCGSDGRIGLKRLAKGVGESIQVSFAYTNFFTTHICGKFVFKVLERALEVCITHF